MLEWITANVVTIAAILAVLLLVGGAIFALIREKKKGKTCTGNCSSCSMGCSCHKS